MSRRRYGIAVVVVGVMFVFSSMAQAQTTAETIEKRTRRGEGEADKAFNEYLPPKDWESFHCVIGGRASGGRGRFQVDWKEGPSQYSCIRDLVNTVYYLMAEFDDIKELTVRLVGTKKDSFGVATGVRSRAKLTCSRNVYRKLLMGFFSSGTAFWKHRYIGAFRAMKGKVSRGEEALLDR